MMSRDSDCEIEMCSSLNLGWVHTADLRIAMACWQRVDALHRVCIPAAIRMVR